MDPRASEGRLRLLPLVALAGLSVLVMFYRLGAAEVCNANEAIEGLFVQQMVEHGAVLFPVANGHDPMYKPPLFHWTALALAKAGGVHRVTALTLRLPAAIYAIAGVMLTAIFCGLLMGENAGLLAALVLLGSYQYVDQGRFGRVDIVLTFCEALALFSFAWLLGELQAGQNSDGARIVVGRYILAAALGLAVLAKGPIGAILPIAAMLIALAIQGELRRLGTIVSPGALLMALAVGSSWYVACLGAARYGFLHRQLGSENFARFFGGLGTMAPWYYLKPLFLNSVPLSLLAPFAVVAALREWLRPSANGVQTPPTAADRVALLMALFWVLTVIFFSLAAYKRRAYLLPLWPASAVLIAWTVEKLAGLLAEGRWLRRGLLALCLGLALINLVLVPIQERADCDGESWRATAATINRVVGHDEPLFLFDLNRNPAPLLFYLDRIAPEIGGQLDDAPPGYVVLPAPAWQAARAHVLDLVPLIEIDTTLPPLILLRRGQPLARR